MNEYKTTGTIISTLKGVNAYTLRTKDLTLSIKSTKRLSINDKVQVQGSLEHLGVYRISENKGVEKTLVKDTRELFISCKTVNILSRSKSVKENLVW